MSRQSKSDSPEWIKNLPFHSLIFVLGVYIVACTWNPCDSTSVSLGSSLILIVMGLALGILALIQGLVRETIREWRTWGVYSGLFFLVWLCVATYASMGATNARISLLGLWQAFALFGFAMALIQVLHDRSKRADVVRWQSGLAVGACGYALYQYFVSMPGTRARFLVDRAQMLAQVEIADGTPEAMQFENRLFSSEPTGTFALTNSLAGYLAPVIVVLFFVGLVSFMIRYSQSSTVGDQSWKQRLRLPSLALSFLVISGILFLTKSRTAWIATALGFGAANLLLYPRSPDRGRRPLLVGAISLGAFFAAGVGLVAWKDPLIFVESWKSLTYRYDYWKGAWDLGMGHPLFGCGPLSFQSYYASVKAVTASENPADPHNMWMEGLVWGGFPLLISMIVMAGWLLLRVAKHRDELLGKGGEPADHHSAAKQSSSRRVSLDWGAWTAMIGLLGWSTLIYSVNGDFDTWVSTLIFVGLACLIAWLLQDEAVASLIADNYLAVSFLSLLVASIHFWFSGGWMQPGAMVSMVVGIAGIIVCCTQHPSQPMVSQRWWQAIGLGGWLVAIFCFARLTLYPEMERSQIESMLQPISSTDLSIEEIEKYLASNKMDPDVAAWISRYSYTQLMNPRRGASSRDAWLKFFDRATDEWITRDRSAWLVYSQVGAMEGNIADQLSRVSTVNTAETKGAAGSTELSQQYIQRSKERFERATELFPSSLPNHLQAAVVSFWAGDIQNANRHLAEVERIDRLTPHLDRKLNAISVWIPSSLEGKDWNLSQSERVATIPGHVKGEPAFSRLRKLVP